MKVSFVICRPASDSHWPGAKLGYWCRACGCELQVLDRGCELIAAGAKPYCSACGLALHTKMAARGTRVAIEIGPEAAQQILRRAMHQNLHARRN